MNRRVRNGILIAIVGVALITLGVFITTRFTQSSLVPVSAAQPEVGETEQVVVTTHQIAEGAVLQTGDLSMVEVPAGLLPAGALTDVASAVGRFVKSEMVAGEMVLGHHLAVQAPTGSVSIVSDKECGPVGTKFSFEFRFAKG